LGNEQSFPGRGNNICKAFGLGGARTLAETAKKKKGERVNNEEVKHLVGMAHKMVQSFKIMLRFFCLCCLVQREAIKIL
jgi:hypothetical protein